MAAHAWPTRVSVRRRLHLRASPPTGKRGGGGDEGDEGQRRTSSRALGRVSRPGGLLRLGHHRLESARPQLQLRAQNLRNRSFYGAPHLSRRTTPPRHIPQRSAPGCGLAAATPFGAIAAELAGDGAECRMAQLLPASSFGQFGFDAVRRFHAAPCAHPASPSAAIAPAAWAQRCEGGNGRGEAGRASTLPSRVLVWPSNSGCGTRTCRQRPKDGPRLARRARERKARAASERRPSFQHALMRAAIHERIAAAFGSRPIRAAGDRDA